MRLIIFCLLLVTQCIGQEIAFEGLEIDEKGFIILDFGQPKQKTKARVAATLINVGDKPLVISRFTTSCGCTVPKMKKKLLLPDEKVSIEIMWMTRAGKFRSSGTINSNATNHPKLWIRLEGEGVQE